MQFSLVGLKEHMAPVGPSYRREHVGNSKSLPWTLQGLPYALELRKPAMPVRHKGCCCCPCCPYCCCGGGGWLLVVGCWLLVVVVAGGGGGGGGVFVGVVAVPVVVVVVVAVGHWSCCLPRARARAPNTTASTALSHTRHSRSLGILC